MRLGYFLSSEEHDPLALVEQAKLAQRAGFEALWISDHFHPWNDEQGQSPFVWSVIAQAAATAGVMTGGRFRLGVGSGEALNEHVTGARWPNADVRLEMLEEAVGVIRELFTGESVDHHGKHYDVEDARIYTRPEQPVPIYVSGFGPKAIEVAARIGDGFVTTKPSSDDIGLYRKHGGEGPVEAGTKVCWAPTKDEGVKTAHRLWSNSGLPGELAQVLPSPKHFEQAATLVTQESTAESVPAGPDPEPYLTTLAEYAEAGVDTLYIAQMGPEQQGFFDFWTSEIAPRRASRQS